MVQAKVDACKQKQNQHHTRSKEKIKEVDGIDLNSVNSVPILYGRMEEAARERDIAQENAKQMSAALLESQINFRRLQERMDNLTKEMGCLQFTRDQWGPQLEQLVTENDLLKKQLSTFQSSSPKISVKEHEQQITQLETAQRQTVTQLQNHSAEQMKQLQQQHNNFIEVSSA